MKPSDWPDHICGKGQLKIVCYGMFSVGFELLLFLA